jgi:hypothetical protein
MNSTITLADGSIRFRATPPAQVPKPPTLEERANVLTERLAAYEKAAAALSTYSVELSQAEAQETIALNSTWLTDFQVSAKCMQLTRARAVYAAHDEQSGKASDALDEALEAFYLNLSVVHREAMDRVKESLLEPIWVAARWPETVSPAALGALQVVIQAAQPVAKMSDLKPPDQQSFAPGRPGYFIRGGRTGVGLAKDLLQKYEAMRALLNTGKSAKA